MNKVLRPFQIFGKWCVGIVKWLFDFKDWKLLLRSVPSYVVAFLVIATVMMNFAANKIIFSSKFVAADGGILLSWIPFICMDVTTRRYGPKAASKLTIFALLCNLVVVGLMALIAFLHIGIGNVNDANPGYASWDEFWSTYSSFDATFSCSWFVLLGSSIGFLASGIINNCLNYSIGLLFRNNKDSKLAFFTTSYVSTFIGQFLDNLLFATIVFMGFAPIYWGYSLTFIQCCGSAIIGAILELIMEIIFSPLGLKVYRKWVKEGVGNNYLEAKDEVKEINN